MNTYAPIILFVYNRLEHTKNTVEALKNNEIAKESNLIIFSDGPRTEKEVEKVHQVRGYIHCISGFQKVIIYESEKNNGLASSVINGVTNVLSEYGKAIIVEDDIIVNNQFLDYMNHALEIYQNEKRVYGVTSFFETFSGSATFDDAFFLPITSPWTWGTWKDRWDKFDPLATGWEHLISDKKLRKQFDFNNTFNNSGMLIAQMEGKLDSWWIRWYWTVFKNNGLYLTPKQSFCSNKGFDGSGTHCDRNGEWDFEHANGTVRKFPSSILENGDVIKKYQKYLKKRIIRRKIGRVKYYLYNPKEALLKIRKKLSKTSGLRCW